MLDDVADAALLGAIAAGRRDAFQAFYERYAGRVLAYARQLAADAHLAEDVMQEVFIAVWRKAASYQAERGDAAGWLYTITRNRVFDHWRRGARAGPPQPFDLASLEAKAGTAHEVRLSLRQALDRLRVEQREAVEMAYFGGFTYEETAHRLGLPVGTLKSRIRGALHTLRAELQA